ncbi:hypothetical protein PIT23_003051 [Clostridioides difficile]|nr:hypothetical protein [Clostridioides difficile]
MKMRETSRAVDKKLLVNNDLMQESIAAARQSMILANVGDMSVDDASSAVNTIINGFRIEPLKEMQVQVGNTTKKTTELTAAMDMLNCLAC